MHPFKGVQNKAVLGCGPTNNRYISDCSSDSIHQAYIDFKVYEAMERGEQAVDPNQKV